MADAVYKKGSLAALRAERAKAREQASESNNVVFQPTTPSISNNNDENSPQINTNTNSSIDNNVENKKDDDNNKKLKTSGPNSNGAHVQSNSGYLDEHGFLLSEEQKQVKLAEIGTDSHRSVIRKQNERIYKWLHMLDNWDTFNTTKKAKVYSFSTFSSSTTSNLQFTH